MMLAWLVALALAQSSPDEEIVVYGELAVQKARDELVAQMEALGWRTVDKGGGELVFKAPSGWMGKARFDPDLGSLDFRRPAAGFRLATYDDPGQTPASTRVDADGQPVDAPMPSGAGFWLLPRKKKVDPVWRAVREATQDELLHYQKIKMGTAFEERLAAIPGRLDRLWAEGVPIEPGNPPLPPGEPRVRAVLELWATRLDSPEGRRMLRAVEAWVDANLVDDGHLTESLREEYEARRDDGRQLPGD